MPLTPLRKALALSARTETRDYVDMVELCRTYPLAAVCWAACGKDPGFMSPSLLKMMRRFARIDPAKLEETQARKLDPIALKMAWIEMSDNAEAQMSRLADEQPDIPIGVAFVDAAGRPGTGHELAVPGRFPGCLAPQAGELARPSEVGGAAW